MKPTLRDLHYLHTIYFLHGDKSPLSPTKLAKHLNVSKVTAYQKMKRLELLNFGTYHRQKGFVMNKKSLKTIEKSILQHHVLECFFAQTLNISCEQACEESSLITSNLSDEFINLIYQKIGEPLNCNCGCKISPPYTHDRIKGCNWCLESFGINKS